MDLFLFITNIDDNYVQIIDEKGNTENLTRKDFEDIWDNNILIIDDQPGKINIPLKSKLGVIGNLAKYTFFISCLVILFAYLLISKRVGNFLFYLYLLGILGGLSASVLLFIEQIDKNNIHIKRLCSSNESKSKIDCSSIIIAQERWCRNHKLYSTPILFINGNKLPSYYNIKDIDYLYS